MKQIYRWIILVLIIAGLQLSACAPAQIPVTGEKIQPATVESIDGSDFKRVTLTQKAAERLDIQTAPVRLEQVNGSEQKIIPYGGVMYGLQGETWTYTNPETLVFIRQSIIIDHIDGDLAFLSEGPDAGTEVVTVGAAMLYGAEVGVSK